MLLVRYNLTVNVLASGALRHAAIATILVGRVSYVRIGLFPVVLQVFEPLCAGFTDAAAALRELTLKSMVAFTSRLSEKNMNDKLIKHLARLQASDNAKRYPAPFPSGCV